jgi:hypothetical protein
MRTSLALALSVGAVFGATLTPVAASATIHGSAATAPRAAASEGPTAAATSQPTPAASGTPTPPFTPPPAQPSSADTTITFSITTGALTITAPTSAAFGNGTVGGTPISGSLGAVTVTDLRAALSASWTAQASSTDFTTGTATPSETVPATEAAYDPGDITTTGTITPHGFPITLSNSPQDVVTGTAGIGDNTASWNPTITISLPPQAVGGDYSGTLTDSVA